MAKLSSCPLLAMLLFALCGFPSQSFSDENHPPEKQANKKLPPGMKPYTESIPHTDLKFEMVPIPGGVFTMGSPDSEPKRKDDEGPQHLVQIEPFWMGKYEITWNEYDTFRYRLDIKLRELKQTAPTKSELKADAVTRPTKEYTDMSFGMGKDGYPAICMTPLAAKSYCLWLSELTGDYYRLPTEAEWEYACRAGTATAYSFGDSEEKLDEYAWHFTNSEEAYQKVGQKKPNPWGLYDMHGNVAEICLDEYIPQFYHQHPARKIVLSPLAVLAKEHPCVVRGGSWDDDPEILRSSARQFTSEEWNVRDPCLPRSIWYFTDGERVGFRIVRPYDRPDEKTINRLKLNPEIPADRIETPAKKTAPSPNAFH